MFSVSSYEKNQAYTASTEWSDEDQTAPNSGNDTNGGTNPFDEDVAKGVRVRALYDYEGQEQDELSFRAGQSDALKLKLETVSLINTFVKNRSCCCSVSMVHNVKGIQH